MCTIILGGIQRHTLSIVSSVQAMQLARWNENSSPLLTHCSKGSPNFCQSQIWGGGMMRRGSGSPVAQVTYLQWELLFVGFSEMEVPSQSPKQSGLCYLLYSHQCLKTYIERVTIYFSLKCGFIHSLSLKNSWSNCELQNRTLKRCTSIRVRCLTQIKLFHTQTLI